MIPHGFLGLGWGEVVSLGTLVVVVLNAIQTWTRNTAHDSNRKDFDDLRNQLFDFKLSVTKLTELLNRLNSDLDKLTKRVNAHGEEIDKLKVEVARLKEHLGSDDDES